MAGPINRVYHYVCALSNDALAIKNNTRKFGGSVRCVEEKETGVRWMGREGRDKDCHTPMKVERRTTV